MKKTILSTLILMASVTTWAQDSLALRLDSLMSDPLFETTQVGLMVYDLQGDSVLYQHHARQLLRPASTMKLVTAITALDRLGGDYEYKTRFCYSGTLSGATLRGNLYVIGGFDPTLTPDDVATMVESIREQGVDTIRGNLVADRTMKETLDYGEGWCWDDDNPMLIPLTIGRKDIFMTTFKRELQRQGVVLVGGQLQEGPAPSNVRTLSTYRHAIDVILERMMKESDNFYAESMFYQTAASNGRKLAKATEARNITRQLIKRLGLSGERYRIADGSGLSLYNYVSAELLVRLLIHAYRTPDIINHLLPSLPIAGIDGTLKKRMIDTPAYDNVKAKTGTVTGISSLAGYMTTADGRPLCFAIINQGVMRSADARAFQDKVCITLCGGQLQ